MLLSAKLIMEEVDRIRRIPTLFDSQRNLSISGTWSSLLMCSFMQFRNDEPEEHIQDNFKETSFQQAVRDVMDQIYRLSIVSCLNSRLELHRLELLVLTDNEQAIKLYKRHGFEVEAKKHHAAVVRGRFVDEYLMGRLRAKEAAK